MTRKGFNKKVGDRVALSEFGYTNKSGGTGLSNWNHNERYLEVSEFIVTKLWYDYECGWRGWCVPVESDVKLIEYLKRNCKEGHHNDKLEWVDQKDEFVCYWSEFDIVE